MSISALRKCARSPALLLLRARKFSIAEECKASTRHASARLIEQFGGKTRVLIREYAPYKKHAKTLAAFREYARIYNPCSKQLAAQQKVFLLARQLVPAHSSPLARSESGEVKASVSTPHKSRT